MSHLDLGEVVQLLEALIREAGERLVRLHSALDALEKGFDALEASLSGFSTEAQDAVVTHHEPDPRSSPPRWC